MESVTKIENSAFWGCVNLKTIRGYAGSYAESYAKEYGYIFEDVEGKITTSYRTHVQSFGWQNPVTNGAMSGTSGEAKRLEAIQIKLYGEMANHFDVYYRVHAQSYGWLGWAKNGDPELPDVQSVSKASRLFWYRREARHRRTTIRIFSL